MDDPSGPPVVPTAGDPLRGPAVREMFDRLAPTYDIANRLMSLGLDQAWRRAAVRALGEAGLGRVVDLCAGTLDITALLVEGGAARVAAVDFSEGMLAAGRAKLAPEAPVGLVVADARDLPLETGAWDGLITSFGLRNVPDLDVVLGECARVLRPGGVMVVLEAFKPERPIARFMHGSYDRVVMPLVGGLVSGEREAYRYLPASMEAFVTRRDLQARLEGLGFEVRGREMFPPLAGLVIATRRCRTP